MAARSYNDWCHKAPESMLQTDAKRRFGATRGPVTCPDCGRTIRLSQGRGVSFTVAPAHKKPADRG